MKAVLVFGEFRMWNLPISPDHEFKPIIIIHPLEQQNLTTEILKSKHPLPITKIKKMTFEFYKQIDHDLLEYHFVREDK